MDLLPQNMNEWMRGVKRDISELKRHRHPSSEAQVGDLRNRVSSLEDQVSTLQSQVADLMDDTGWVQLGPQDLGNWDNFTEYRRIGETVTIRSWLRWTAAFPESGARVDIGTLPEPERPGVQVWATVYNTDDGTSAAIPRSMEVDTDGTVFIMPEADGGIGQNESLLATTMSFPRG